MASFFEKRGWLYLDFRCRGIRKTAPKSGACFADSTVRPPLATSTIQGGFLAAGRSHCSRRRRAKGHRFGDRAVSTLAQDEVETFITELKRPQVLEAAAGDSPARVRKLSNRRVNIILKVLRQSLDRAVRRGWLETNPARAIDLLREERTVIQPFRSTK